MYCPIPNSKLGLDQAKTKLGLDQAKTGLDLPFFSQQQEWKGQTQTTKKVPKELPGPGNYR